MNITGCRMVRQRDRSTGEAHQAVAMRFIWFGSSFRITKYLSCSTCWTSEARDLEKVPTSRFRGAKHDSRRMVAQAPALPYLLTKDNVS